jgi:2-polyprenyl-3-methyl-5-hydroxy-6-metoxy-1,4-benzoquinol methylase
MSHSVAKHFHASLLRKLAESLSPKALDESAVPSYTHWNPAIRWLMFRRLDLIGDMALQVLSQRPDSTGRAGLDFGCGVGLLMPIVAPAVEILYVCDTNLAPSKATARHFGIKNVVWVEPDQLTNQIADASLDVVIAADVLEHVKELDKSVELFRQKLRRDGALIISGPMENLVYKLGRWIAGFSGDYHVRSVFDVEEAVRGDGFVLEQFRTLPFALPPALFRLTLWRVRD